MILDGGALRCWGYGATGALGYGNTNTIGDDETPASIGNVDVGGPVKQVAAGDYANPRAPNGSGHTCALLVNGEVRCWGSGALGQLGYGNTDTIGDDETPAQVGAVDVGGPVAQIAAGTSHTCALLVDGAVRCWGSNYRCALGEPGGETIGDDETPASVGDIEIGGPALQVAVGDGHTCVLLTDGRVRCWGMGENGQLGDGESTADVCAPSATTVDIDGGVVQLSTSGHHTCALLASGAVQCWGRSRTWSSFGGTARQVSAGGLHSCVVLANGAVRCMGSDMFGVLGGSGFDGQYPGDITIGGPVQEIAAGLAHTCALMATGAVRCWGLGDYGALGYGSIETIGDDELPASAGEVQVQHDLPSGDSCSEGSNAGLGDCI